ncbi:PQQ-binding-like beta-propeller repeat protein [Streptomyces exfoliatus]|uniref:outer membrane protein assembly factor BamB family protein n=1 Tax=Streptomyces exfoliatus TaxID=1905 RepID=UPI003C2DA0F7
MRHRRRGRHEGGRELWKAPLSEPDPPRFQHSSVSAGSGVAVLLQKDDLHAVDVRTGKSRWKGALPKDCVPGRTAVAERQVAALLACGGTDNIRGHKVTEDAELHVATFDPATGALLWSAPLGGRRAILWDASAAFVSADPVVVAASASNDSDAGAYLSFGRNGRPKPPIDFIGPHGEIGFSDRLRASVDGSRLYLLPRHRKVERLTALDLATGDAVWGGTRHDDLYEGDSGDQLVLQDGKVTLLTSRRRGPYRLHDFDPATGERSEVRVLPDDLGPADKLFTYEGRLVVARYAAYSTGSRPFTAYERR